MTSDASLACSKPQPCNSIWVNHFAMLLVFAFLGYFYVNDPAVINEYVLWLPIAYALPISLYEVLVLKTYQREMTGLEVSVQPLKLARVVLKFYGFCIVLAVIAFLYWLLPEYDDGLYQTFFNLAQIALPYLLVVSLLYFLWMDTRLKQPEDEYWHLGKLFLGQWKVVNKRLVVELTRGWLVKAFFLPLMAHFLYVEVGQFVNAKVGLESDFYAVYDQIIRLVLIADLIPACIGYAMTLKLFDNHIRSADDSFRGWFFCLVCYPPFWGALFYSHYLPYMESYNWASWLGGHPLRWLWAAMLVMSLVIYASASVCFGTRWSNLTYRGLMCQGPYAIVRHPAYFFKNISWWLIAVPFVVEGTVLDAVKQFCFCVGVSFVYYQRAITEERHLSRYPEYRNYALWMNDHGPFKFISQVPLFRYSPEKYGY